MGKANNALICTMTVDEDNRHSPFWFEDGSLILHVQSRAFKIHKDIFSRHSRISLSHDPESMDRLNASSGANNGANSQCLHYVVPAERGVTADDVAVLLDYIYSNPYVTISDLMQRPPLIKPRLPQAPYPPRRR